MTAAPLPPPTIDCPIQAPPHAPGLITRVQDAVRALPAPALPQDTAAATTISDLASTHIIDAHTLAVVARKDRHIHPIAAVITEHLLGVTVSVVGSAVTVTLV